MDVERIMRAFSKGHQIGGLSEENIHRRLCESGCHKPSNAGFPSRRQHLGLNPKRTVKGKKSVSQS
jgi:hypothetical protein